MTLVNTIYNEDCMDTMAKWPDNAVDVIVTSPPWNAKKDYGPYSNDKKEDYVIWLTRLCQEMERVAANAVYVFMSQEYMWELKEALSGFTQWLYYHRRNIGATGRIKNKWIKTITPIAMSVTADKISMESNVKGVPTIDLITGVNPQSDYIHNKRVHPAQDPVEAYLPIVARTPGKIFYDPFMGSGTLALTAIKLGKQYVGSEINPDFVDIAQKRIKQEVSQVDMFNQSTQLTI